MRGRVSWAVLGQGISTGKVLCICLYMLEENISVEWIVIEKFRRKYCRSSYIE